MSEVTVDAENIPERFKEREKWLLWDKSYHTPRQPHWRGDFGVSWNDPDDWHSFDEAIAAARERDSWGIGYAVTEDDDEYIIDVDGGFTAEGEPRSWFPGVDRFADAGTYMEWSPSDDGTHIIVEGEPPKWYRNSEVDDADHQGVDVLTNSFCTFTGDQLEAAGDEVAAVNAAPFLFHVYQNIRGEAPRIEPEDGDTDEEEGYDGDGDLTKEQVAEALDHVDENLHYNDWLRVGMAVYDWDDGSTGKRLFEKWSKTNAKWDPSRGQRHIDDIWDNDSPRGDVTVGTLVHHATKGGWEPPWEKARATTDGGAVPDEPSAENDDMALSALEPANIRALAGMGEDGEVADLNDRQKAALVWELIRKNPDVHVRVRRENGSLWAYDNGVWTNTGERALRHAARKALGAPNYGQNVLTELKEQARADPAVEVDADRFGVEPGHVAVENGLLDLEAAADGEGMDAIRDLKPHDYALTKLPVEYDPDASYDEWDAHVEEWVEEGRADALQEYVGYCLHVGEIPIHRALLLVGSGANGKGTFLSVVRSLLGRDNTTSIELQTLANERDAVAEFYGSLANIDDDLSARKLGNGLGMFKKLVAGDRVRARRLYEDGFEFDATGKHLYAANEVPEVKVPEEDEAFWRRWLLVEFPNHYPPSERDPTLRDQLTEPEALSGVLNWAIKGRARLLEQRHFTNEERYAAEKRTRWMSWGDSVDKFVEECLERDEDADNVATSEVHRRYTAWCRENGHESVGQQKLTNHLKKEAFDYGRKRVDGKQARAFGALSISDEVPDPEDDEISDSSQTSLSSSTPDDASGTRADAERLVQIVDDKGEMPIDRLTELAAAEFDMDADRFEAALSRAVGEQGALIRENDMVRRGR